MVAGGMKCVKLLLFAFNFVFVLAAIGLIAAGAYVQVALKDYFQLIDGSFSSAAALLIAVGVLTFVIAAFGCCGAYKENHTCVMVFAVLLIIIFIMEIAGGIAGFVMKGKVNELTEKYMKESMKSDATIWDKVQKDFTCCGIDKYTDWENEAQKPVPKSCCKVPESRCDPKDKDQIYQDGCFGKFTTWLDGKIHIVGAIGIALAFVQIVGIVLACCLARAIKSEFEVV